MRLTAITLAMALSGASHAQMLFSSGFEDQAYSCWGNRNSNGSVRTSCGALQDILYWPAQLTGYGWFGFKQIEFTYETNEDDGRVSVAITPPQDVLYVRAYYIFHGQFDFPQGLKLGKVKGPAYGCCSDNEKFDVVLQSQSEFYDPVNNPGFTQQGLNQNKYLGMFDNNPFSGYQWDEVKAEQPFQPGHPYCIEYMVALNTPGQSDGQIQVWVDGVSIASANNRNIRPRSDWHIDEVRFGGNYSNAKGPDQNHPNPYPDPAYASIYDLDEVAISTARIGCE